MAIAFDTSATSTDQTTSPATWSHTCTGSNLLLVVGVDLASNNTTGGSVSAVTYNGISMTQAVSLTQTIGVTSDQSTSIWFLHNPPTGANTVSVAFSGGTNPHIGGISASYTGAQQNSSPDAFNTANISSAGGSQSFTVTTVADNCWVFAIGVFTAGGAPTLAANQTSRGVRSLAATISAVIRAEDTNTPTTPAGATTVGFTSGADLALRGGQMIGASFAPFTAPIGGFNIALV